MYTDAQECFKMRMGKNPTTFGKKPHSILRISSPTFAGICSHVLTINHLMRRFNVRFQLKSVQTNTLKKKVGLMGGNNRKAHRCQPFSASPKWSPTPERREEAERLQLLGQQGR